MTGADRRVVVVAMVVVVAARLHPIGTVGGAVVVGGTILASGAVLGLALTQMLGPMRAHRGPAATPSGESAVVRFGTGVALAVCAAVGVSVLSVRSLGGLHVAPGVVTATVTVLRDPLDDVGGGARVEVRLGGKHVLARARGTAGSTLRSLSAGRVVRLTGTVRPRPLAPWRVARHLAGDLNVTAVQPIGRGNALAQLADAIRDRLLRSAAVLPPTDRSLFAGFLLGDARAQSPLVTDDFRGSGLSHLLVVSGQNVAFLLASFGGLLRSLGRRGRFVAVLSLLTVFAAVTRFEPSVLRAATMSALASFATVTGRPQSSLRLLALATIALVVIDPLLAWSVGFAMSVAACVGLAVATPRLDAALRGARWPGWLATPVATALGAEIGVACVMLPTFGGVPLVSLPANLAALPAAEPVMGWGVVAGLPAGLVEPWLGSWPSRIVHLPTRLALDWVRLVAARATALPLGDVTPRQALLLSGAVAATATLRRSGGRRSLRTALVVLAGGVVAAPLAASAPATLALGPGASASGARGTLERHVDVVRLRHGAQVADVLEALRRARIRAVDLVVVESGGRPQAAVLRAVAARVDLGAVLVGARPIAGPVRPVAVGAPGLVLRSGATIVTVTDAVNGRLTTVLTGSTTGLTASAAALAPSTTGPARRSGPQIRSPPAPVS